MWTVKIELSLRQPIILIMLIVERVRIFWSHTSHFSENNFGNLSGGLKLLKIVFKKIQLESNDPKNVKNVFLEIGILSKGYTPPPLGRGVSAGLRELSLGFKKF